MNLKRNFRQSRRPRRTFDSGNKSPIFWHGSTHNLTFSEGLDRFLSEIKQSYPDYKACYNQMSSRRSLSRSLRLDIESFSVHMFVNVDSTLPKQFSIDFIISGIYDTGFNFTESSKFRNFPSLSEIVQIVTNLYQTDVREFLELRKTEISDSNRRGSMTKFEIIMRERMSRLDWLRFLGFDTDKIEIWDDGFVSFKGKSHSFMHILDDMTDDEVDILCRQDFFD
jgi:hypothetical protein